MDLWRVPYSNVHVGLLSSARPGAHYSHDKLKINLDVNCCTGGDFEPRILGGQYSTLIRTLLNTSLSEPVLEHFSSLHDFSNATTL